MPTGGVRCGQVWWVRLSASIRHHICPLPCDFAVLPFDLGLNHGACFRRWGGIRHSTNKGTCSVFLHLGAPSCVSAIATKRASPRQLPPTFKLSLRINSDGKDLSKELSLLRGGPTHPSPTQLAQPPAATAQSAATHNLQTLRIT